MKRQLIAVLTAMGMAAAVVAAQTATQDPATSQTKSPDVTLTGCLIQGATPTSFLLDNARSTMQDPAQKGQTYHVIAATEDLGLAQQINHEVSVTGTADQKVAPAPPAGQKIDDNDLPKLMAKAVTMVSDRCTATK